MNTALLTKKALKSAENFYKNYGLEKVFQNKTIDSTDVMVDARTGSVEVEQTYRKLIKIKKDVYVVGVELTLTLHETVDGEIPNLDSTFNASLNRIDEYEMEIPLHHNFGEAALADFCAFINSLPKLKVKSLEELKIV